MTEETSEGVVMMNERRIARALKRMALEVEEQAGHETAILLLGIRDRGYVVARQLGQYLRETTQLDVAVEPIDVRSVDPSAIEYEGVPPLVLLVDDVIFSGRTFFQALRHISRTWDPLPERVLGAVLVDRGHRKMPVEACFVGLYLSTKLREHVQVEMEHDEVQQVVLLRNGNGK